MIRPFFIGFLCVCIAPGCKSAGQDQQDETIKGATAFRVHASEPDTLKLDHVPIAVRELEQAVNTYRDVLGFSIKPGRLHPNSIENAHIKFADGTALELITAKEPADALAGHYLALLREGEGAAFLSMDGGDAGHIAKKPGIRQFYPNEIEGSYANSVTFDFSRRIGYWFFLEYTNPPVDKAEHLEHENGALALEAVWLAGPSLNDEIAILSSFGKRKTSYEVEHPVLNEKGTVYKLDRGSLYLYTGDVASFGISPIQGVSIRVKNLEETRSMLQERLGLDLEVQATVQGHRISIKPENTHGIWLEFIEPKY